MSTTSKKLAVRPPRPSNPDRILETAIACFLEKGYHGTTVRDIGRRSQVSVPGLYHHYPSKLTLLDLVIKRVMNDLFDMTSSAVADAGPDPVDRFKAAVMAHVRFHCERQAESFIGNTELRSLPPDYRREVIALRDRQQRIFDAVVEDGVQAGKFHLDFPHETSRAVVTMCTAVASWYHTDGPMSVTETVTLYRTLALNLVAYTAV
jgi:AcrR family transcriptional regulator